MRTLITGGCGFIGRALCARLESIGHEVLAFDDFSRFSRDYPLRPNSKFVAGSVLNRAAIDKAINDFRPTAVVHAAAINGTVNFYARPFETLRVAAVGSIVVAEACAEAGIQTVINLSSSEVYGRNGGVSMIDDDFSAPSLSPRSSYAVGKMVGEIAFRESTIPRVVNVRPFNIYGENMGHDHVIPELTKKIVEAYGHHASLVKLIGDGRQVRSFCHIDDFTAAIASIFNVLSGTSDNEVRWRFNVGRPEPVTIVELAQHIFNEFPKPWPKLAVGTTGRSGETVYRLPSIAEIQKTTDWQPKISLSEGLPPVVRAYAKEYSK